jgi:hypothetical protein|tara:strand:+ start:438 stop:908 length:471 start_codon:yes stop_codon:yes gene_type:complete
MEYLDEAREEIKRVDHLVYVSLKYTRTVDVIKSVVVRIINSFNFAILELLEHAKEKKKLKEYPSAHGLRCDTLQRVFPENMELKEYLSFYQLLRRINRADYTKREEYRRHVTMITNLDDGEVIDVDIDLLKEYYDKVRAFVGFVKNMVEGNKENLN